MKCCDCTPIVRYCMTCRPPTGETRRPCSWPHGCCYSFMAMMSAFAGCMMNYFVLKSCYMQRIKLINPVTGDTIPGSERGYGFSARETDYGLESDYQDCSYYTAEEKDLVFDGMMNAGKFFAYVSMILGCIAFLILFSTCMVAYSADMFERWLFWTFISATCACGLICLCFGSDYCQEHRCKVAPGTGYTITTFMFWLSTINSVKSMGGAMPENNKKNNKMRNPFKRNRGPKNNNQGDDEFDDMDDLYYEDEADKYPLPEMTPEGRWRYQDAEEYANDTEKAFARKYDKDYNSDEEDEDEDDYSYGEEEYDPNDENANKEKDDKEYIYDDEDDEDYEYKENKFNRPEQEDPPDFSEYDSDSDSEGAAETFENEQEEASASNQGNVEQHDDDDGDDVHRGYDRTPKVGDEHGPLLT